MPIKNKGISIGDIVMFTKLTEFLDSQLDSGIPGFDFILYHDGKCVYRHMNGYSDYENKIKMKGDERYNIYSCSKLITCTSALMLFERGMFKLEDKLSDYMPEFKDMTVRQPDGTITDAKNPITIRDLFRMTAGFTYDLTLPSIIKGKAETDGKCPTREMMKYIAKEPLAFEPSEGWQYSICHDVLAALVEVISGNRFGNFVKQNIFDPMGMTHTTFLLPDNELDTISPQYRYDDQKGVLERVGNEVQTYKLGSEFESGGAGCISTIEDYIKFIEGIRTFRLLSEDTVKLLSTDTLSQELFDNYYLEQFKTRGYGYGLGVRCYRAGSDITDFGWDGAAGSHYAIYIENKITLVYTQHVLNSPNNNFTKYAKLDFPKVIDGLFK